MRFVISRKNSLFILLLILLILGGIKFKDRVFKIYPLTSFFPDSSSTPEIHGPVRICLNSWSEFAARDFQIFPGPGPVRSTTVNFRVKWTKKNQVVEYSTCKLLNFYPFDEFLVKWNVWVGWKRLCGRYSKRVKHMNTLKSYQIENYLI